MSDQSVLPLYAQLLGVGILWVTIHCSGMCGPIMAGLVIGTGTTDAVTQPWRHRWSVAKQVFAYQSGRGIMYALLGMSAGFLGARVETAVQTVASFASLTVALALLIAGFLKLPDVVAIRQALAARRRTANAEAGHPPPKPKLTTRFVGAMMRALPSAQQLSGPARMFVVGFILGLLPCSLTFWVLGLSAASTSPLHGALLMLVLIALTTPVLLAAGLSTTLISPRLRRYGANLVPFGMMLSGIWLLLISLAANGLIAHAHLPLRFGDREYMLMLW